MDNTLNLIAKLNYLMQKFIVASLEKQGIKGIVPSHGAIVFALLRHQKLPMNELAKIINKDPSTVTTLVKKLTNLGYTEISKGESDKRTSMVSLTSKGKDLEKVVQGVSDELYQKQYCGINESEINTFRSILEKMIANFD